MSPNPILLPEVKADLYDSFSHENTVIFRRNVPVDVQNEDRFSPMNTFAFNPLAQEYFSIDNAVLALIVLKLAKKSPELLAKLAEKYMDNVTGLLGKIVEVGESHPLTALNSSTMFAVVAHRFGIITDSGYLKIADQTRSIVDKLIQLNFAQMGMDGLTTLVKSAETAGAKGIPALASLAGLPL